MKIRHPNCRHTYALSKNRQRTVLARMQPHFIFHTLLLFSYSTRYLTFSTLKCGASRLQQQLTQYIVQWRVTVCVIASGGGVPLPPESSFPASACA